MKYLYTLPLLAFPFLAIAQSGQVNNIFSLLDLISNLISATIPVIIGLAVLVFIWGILRYVIAKDSEEQKNARGVILWGVIILFVMVSIWGLVNLLQGTLNLDNDASKGPEVPGIRR